MVTVNPERRGAKAVRRRRNCPCTAASTEGEWLSVVPNPSFPPSLGTSNICNPTMAACASPTLPEVRAVVRSIRASVRCSKLLPLPLPPVATDEDENEEEVEGVEGRVASVPSRQAPHILLLVVVLVVVEVEVEVVLL